MNNKKYNIVEVGNEDFILCSPPSLKLAKKILKDMKKTDKELQKYYNWSRVPQYKIKESE